MAFEHDCDTIERLIAERSERTLRPDEAIGVARAVASCESCKGFYAMHDEVVDLLPKTRVDGASLLSEGFTDRLMAKLAAQRAGAVSNRDADEGRDRDERPEQDETSGARRIARVPDDAPPTRTTIEMPVTPSVRKDGPGTIRHLPRWRTVVAAAAVLLATLFGIRLLSESGSIGATERCGNVMVRRASASAPTWEVLPDRPTLQAGDELYVAADSATELRLADDVTVELADDCLATLRANAVEVLCGTAIVRAPEGHPAIVDTPLGRVTARGGETVVRVDRPFASTSNRAARGELIAWVRSGSAAWSRGGTTAETATIAAGEARVIADRGPATTLSASESTLLAESVGRIGSNPPVWSPDPTAAIGGSLALALTDRTFPEAVTAAVSIAGRLGYADVVANAPDTLGTTSNKPDPAYATALATALVRTETTTRESRLTRLLVDGDESVRVLAARALGAIGSPTAIDTLARAATDERNGPGARLAATLAVASLDRPAPVDAAALARDAEHDAAVRAIRSTPAGTTADLGALAALANDRARSPLDRLEAVEALKALCDPNAEPALIRATTDPDPRIRNRATSALSNARVFKGDLPPAARDALVARVHDASLDERSRRIALNALVNRAYGNAELVPLVQDRSLPISLRALAARSIDKSKIDAAQSDYLLAAIEAERPATNVTPIITSLLDPATPRNALLDRLEDRDPRIVEAAAKSLSRSLRNKHPWTPTEIDRLRRVRIRVSTRTARNYLRLTLTRVSPDSAASDLIAEWSITDDVSARLNILLRLRQVTGDEVDRFARAVVRGESSPQLRASAAEILAQRGSAGRAALPDISALYESLVDRDPHMVLQATFAVARSMLSLGDERAVPDLRRVVMEGGESAGTAARTLASVLGTDRATALLIPARENSDARVRYHVARTFVDLGFDRRFEREIRSWQQRESEPWIQMLLAVALYSIDRTPLVEQLRRFRDDNNALTLSLLIEQCEVESFESLLRATASGQLASTVKTELTRAIKDMSTTGRRTLRATALRPDDQAPRRYSKSRSMRAQLVRNAMRSTCAKARATAATAARAAMDVSFLPILIDLLTDPSPEVREAAFETLSATDRELVTGYDAHATAARRTEAAQTALGRLHKRDLETIVSRPRAVSILDSRK